MLTKKVKWRASLIGLLILATIVSIFYLLESLNKNILYFKSPTDVQLIKEKDLNKKIRIGGWSKKFKINNKEIKFVVTDFNNELIVSLAEQFLIYFQRERELWLRENYKIKSFYRR